MPGQPRFLNVGPLHPENDQLIDITGDEMKLVHDGPTYPEPHDAVLVKRELIHPSKMMVRDGPRFEMYEKMAAEDGVDLMKDSKVIRKGPNKVHVYMVSVAPAFSQSEFRVKTGDEVQLVPVEHLGGRVHGIVEQQELGLVGEGGCQLGPR